jgi:hypothetical protein
MVQNVFWGYHVELMSNFIAAGGEVSSFLERYAVIVNHRKNY